MGRITYTMAHDRPARSCTFRFTCTEPVEALDVRVGPFPIHLRTFDGAFEVEHTPTASWIWLRGLKADAGETIEKTISLW